MQYLRMYKTAVQEISREAWDTYEEAKFNGSVKDRTAALGLAHKINTDIVKLFQEAGLTEDLETMQRLRETEEKQEQIIAILKEIAKRYPEAAEYLRKELAALMGKAEVLAIEA